MILFSTDVAESCDTVQAFAAQQKLTFAILVDETGPVAQMYRARAVPYSLFIDRQRVMRTVHIGPMDERLLKAFLGRIL